MNWVDIGPYNAPRADIAGSWRFREKGKNGEFMSFDLKANNTGTWAYEHDVPAVNVLDEVVATWFDDTYLPDAEPFKEFFSGAELKAMAKFSRYFEERINHLPPTASGVGVWLKDENWQRIMQEARDLVVALQAG